MCHVSRAPSRRPSRSAPRKRVVHLAQLNSGTRSPTRSAAFPARGARSPRLEFGPGKLRGSCVFTRALLVSPRTLRRTQGVAAGAFAQREIPVTDRQTRSASRSFPSEPVRTCGSSLGSFGDNELARPGPPRAARRGARLRRRAAARRFFHTLRTGRGTQCFLPARKRS